MPKLSICIPVYARDDGLIEKFLTESFVMLSVQSFKNFEVVISDDSRHSNIHDLCNYFSTILNIRYHKNRLEPSLANNMNNALRYATGDIVKILFQDDFLLHPNVLEKIVEGFDINPDKNWLLMGFTHCNSDRSKFYDGRLPWFGNKYVNGDNTTGNPSSYSVRKECIVEFDPNLKFLVDGEMFYRSYYYHGDPIILNDVLVCFRDHEHSSYDKPEFYNVLEKEKEYCVDKYNKLSKGHE